MSSPKVNNLIILGSILCYISIILYGMDTHMMPKGTSRMLCGVSYYLFNITSRQSSNYFQATKASRDIR